MYHKGTWWYSIGHFALYHQVHEMCRKFKISLGEEIQEIQLFLAHNEGRQWAFKGDMRGKGVHNEGGQWAYKGG